MRTGKKIKSPQSTWRSRLVIFILLAATFFTGVRYWLQVYSRDYEIISLPQEPARASKPVLRPVSTEEVFIDEKGENEEETLITLDPDSRISGAIVAEFLSLQQQGIIPTAALPLNPFRAPGYGPSGQAAATPAPGKMADVADTMSLGLYTYDCAAHGYDSYTFHWQGSKPPTFMNYKDIADKGYLFISMRTKLAADDLSNNIYNLQFQTSDSSRILRAATAQLNWKGKDNATEWADLQPEELQTFAKCLSIIRECVRPGMSDYEKSRALAEYLCKHLEYHNLKDSRSVFYRHRGRFVIYALTPLLEGRTGNAICEGYTKTYGLLLTLCGIPSMEVSGKLTDSQGGIGYHAWNLVYLKGQGWYHVDTTWMDKRGGIDYHYFMCTDSFLTKDPASARQWPIYEDHLPYPASSTTQAH